MISQNRHSEIHRSSALNQQKLQRTDETPIVAVWMPGKKKFLEGVPLWYSGESNVKKNWVL